MVLDKETLLQRWGEGKWMDEPDYGEFEHEGLKCLVRRISPDGGHLCGYVRIPTDHKLRMFEMLSSDIINVYGGITFDGRMNDEHWIGFDCSDRNYVIPGVKRYAYIHASLPKGYGELFCNSKTYKDWDFVVEETKSLASQVRALQ